MKLEYPNVIGTIDIYMDVMRALCGDTAGKSMIDLCCHKAPNTPKLGFAQRKYVDILPQTLDHPEEQQFFHQMDVLNASSYFPSEIFDVSICSDGIEHLYKSDGEKLCVMMVILSKRQVLFTPLTDLFGMADKQNHDPEAHRSLWSLDDFNNTWITISFPDYHKGWNGGAFFAMHINNNHLAPTDDSSKIQYQRIATHLDSLPWAK